MEAHSENGTINATVEEVGDGGFDINVENENTAIYSRKRLMSLLSGSVRDRFSKSGAGGNDD